MKLYSLRRGFLHRVHCRRLSPLSTRMRSLRRELLFGRCATETSPWIRPLVLQRGASFDHLVGAGKQERWHIETIALAALSLFMRFTQSLTLTPSGATLRDQRAR